MYSLNIFEYWAHENWWLFLWNMNNACCCFSPKYRFIWFISVTQPAMNHPILGGSSQLNSKLLIAMVRKSFPLPSGRFMVYTWKWSLTTGPTPGMILQVQTDRPSKIGVLEEWRNLVCCLADYCLCASAIQIGPSTNKQTSGAQFLHSSLPQEKGELKISDDRRRSDHKDYCNLSDPGSLFIFHFSLLLKWGSTKVMMILFAVEIYLRLGASRQLICQCTLEISNRSSSLLGNSDESTGHLLFVSYTTDLLFLTHTQIWTKIYACLYQISLSCVYICALVGWKQHPSTFFLEVSHIPKTVVHWSRC